MQTHDTLQLILDFSFPGVLPTPQPPPPRGDALKSIECATKGLCFALHRSREEIMKVYVSAYIGHVFLALGSAFIFVIVMQID